MEAGEKTSPDANSMQGEDKQPDQSAGRPLTTPLPMESTESDSHAKEKDELVKTETVGMEPKVNYSNMTSSSLLDPESLEDLIFQPPPGTGRTKTPDSSRPKSSSSGEIMFEAKRRRRKVASGPNAHTVTFTVNIAMAIPTGQCLVKKLVIHNFEYVTFQVMGRCDNCIYISTQEKD